MSPEIRELDAVARDRIAAGEVGERPASTERVAFDSRSLPIAGLFPQRGDSHSRGASLLTKVAVRAVGWGRLLPRSRR